MLNLVPVDGHSEILKALSSSRPKPINIWLQGIIGHSVILATRTLDALFTDRIDYTIENCRGVLETPS